MPLFGTEQHFKLSYRDSAPSCDCVVLSLNMAFNTMFFTVFLLIFAFIPPVHHVISKPPWQISEIGLSATHVSRACGLDSRIGHTSKSSFFISEWVVSHPFCVHLLEYNAINYDNTAFCIDDANLAVSGDAGFMTMHCVYYFDHIFMVYNVKCVHFTADEQALHASYVSACNNLCRSTCKPFCTPK